MKSDLRLRLGVAGVGIPLCAMVVFAGGPLFGIGLGLVAGVGYWEYASIQQAGMPRPFVNLGAVGAGLFPLAVLFFGLSGAWVLATLLLMAFGAYGMMRIPIEEGPLSRAAAAAYGSLYVGGLIAFGVPLRTGGIPGQFPAEEGVAAGRLAATLVFFYPVVTTWLADSAAYFGGRRFGRRPLAPRVSPNKTVEGAVAALVAGPLAAAAYSVLALPEGWRLSIPASLLFGLVVAGFAIVGDLVESALKREMKVKDSSSLLPGHGGLLDRLDSILWALPAAYFFYALAP